MPVHTDGTGGSLVPYLSSPTLSHAYTRLRAAWSANWGLYTLTTISIVHSILDASLSGIHTNQILGFLASAALLLVPRFPWTAVTVIVPSEAYNIMTSQFTGATVATWFAIGHLMYRRRYLQLFLALLTLVCTNLVAWLMGQEVGPHLQQLTIFTTVCFGMVAVLRRADTSLAKAEATRIEALHNQRALIARELHDTLARANTHIVLLAQNARNNPHDHHQTTTALDDIITTGRQSVTDLRTMLRLLRQDTNTPLDPTPTANLHTALTQTQHDLTTAGLHTTITHEGDLTTLSPTLTTTLTHILHESTANMIKHAAPDAQCTIQLDITDTHAELLVINPLANHHRDQQLSSGLGLLGIQERSRALGGTTTITPTAHQWILHTTLPLTPKDTPQPEPPVPHDSSDLTPPSPPQSELDGAFRPQAASPAEAPTHLLTRLRAAWSANWGLYTLTATVLCLSASSLPSLHFGVLTLLGLLVPWTLLLVPRFPWTAVTVIALSAAWTISTGTFTATVVTAWLALFLLLNDHHYPQVLVIAAATAGGNLLAWRAGRNMGVFMTQQASWALLCFGMVAVLRRADTSLAKAEATRIEALHNQRALIARELHDTLARANTHIVLLAQNARNNPHDHHQTTTALDDIITTGRQSVTDLRTMLRLLRQDTNTPLDPTPTANLHTALTQTQHDLTTAGLHTTITHEGDLTTLSPTLTTTLTHILHESTANMIKHAAPDAQCTIQLDITDTHAELLVINPLANHHRDQQLSSGLGLLGIQERSRALGGTTTITPTAHQWILHTTLPLTPKDTP